MQSPFADTSVLDCRRSPVVPLGMAKRPLSWIKIIGAAGLLGGMLLLAGMFMLSRTITVSGKVISVETQTPIEGAMVYVHSAAPYEEDGLNSYARTGPDGRFTARARGEVTVDAWKPGFALHGVNAGYAPTLLRREIVIELRELTRTNWVPEHDEIHHLAPGDGFSFRLGNAVAGDSPDADIVVTQDLNDSTSANIEARGEGGIILQTWDSKVDFYNSPQAPEKYEQSATLVPGKAGHYFVRTRDGTHYAKFRLLVYLAKPPKGAPYLDFKDSRLIWAYQPDGTRNLEISPGKSFPFPVEEFGMKRESLVN